MRTLLALLAAVCAAAQAADPVDRQKLYDHIHKRFSTPTTMKLHLGELKPSPLPGYLTGTLEFRQGDARQLQQIHITRDGRRYVFGVLHSLAPSEAPGLRAPRAVEGELSPPKVFVSPDGRHLLHAVFGPPQDLTVDPDKENLAKMRLDDGTPAWGPPDAPVTVVEYSDLQCPHCKKAHETLEAELPKAYSEKVRWISKSYPLRNAHPWAYDAAVAAACAGLLKPEAYRALKSDFFRDQASVSPGNVREKALAYARKAGLGRKEFEACLDGPEGRARVDAHIKEGEALGITGTPTIYVNGRRAPALPFEALSQVIDEMLKNKE